MRCLKLSACLAFLTVAIALIEPARAEWLGIFPRDNNLVLSITNLPSEFDVRAAVTVYYVGRSMEVMGIITVPAGETNTLVCPKPGRASRIIIEVDPPPGGRTTISVNATTPRVCEHVRDGDTFRIVYDVQ